MHLSGIEGEGGFVELLLVVGVLHPDDTIKAIFGGANFSHKLRGPVGITIGIATLVTVVTVRVADLDELDSVGERVSAKDRVGVAHNESRG